MYINKAVVVLLHTRDIYLSQENKDEKKNN